MAIRPSSWVVFPSTCFAVMSANVERRLIGKLDLDVRPQNQHAHVQIFDEHAETLFAGRRGTGGGVMRFSRRREDLAVGLFRICCINLSEPRRSSRTVQDSPIAVIGALGYLKSKEGGSHFRPGNTSRYACSHRKARQPRSQAKRCG